MASLSAFLHAAPSISPAPGVVPLPRIAARLFAAAIPLSPTTSDGSATFGASAGLKPVAALCVSALAGLAVGLHAKGRAAHRQSAGPKARLTATQGDEIKFSSPVTAAVREEEALPPMGAAERAQALAESLPGLAALAGTVVVIKYGGAAMVTSPERTIRDVAVLQKLGLRPVLVHGGGPFINSWLAKVGIQPKFVDGVRVTDKETMEVAAMVLQGKVNKGIVATMGAAGVSALGLSGVDGGLLQAQRVENETLGFVGDVTGVNVAPLLAAFDRGLLPVVATIAADCGGNLLNINADIAAAAIAGALGANEFVLMTDVPGLLRDVSDPSSKIAEIDPQGAKALIDEGVVAGGMIPKVTCCLRAVEAGVRATRIIDGRRPHALLEELLSVGGDVKHGTTIRSAM